ncbi:hypothetical protein H5410_049292 [Solanum commersonii]|uniref:Uncharacterized protein n=1 Tax=Solanum commersonii TaxID=4109 RepID=A0A9J5XM35_SOLCO|nr:hypothetical protein H5410_049292 [Solanum commersonii]
MMTQRDFQESPTMITFKRHNSTLKALFGPFAKHTRNETTSQAPKAQMKTEIEVNVDVWNNKSTPC